jgi:hypothetical protein
MSSGGLTDDAPRPLRMGGLPAHRPACRDCHPMKTERLQLQAFVLFLFLVVVLAFASAASAAVITTPTVAGYARDSVTGGYLNNRAGSGQALFDSASRTYGSTGSFNVGGKSMSVPTKIPIASTAGTVAKNAMRMNPYLLAGSIALPWLLDQGLEYLEGEGWVKSVPDPAPIANLYWDVNYSGPATDACNNSNACSWSESQAAVVSDFAAVNPNTNTFTWSDFTVTGAVNATAKMTFKQNANTYSNTFNFTGTGVKPDDTSPATDGDWDGLPDPTQNGPLADELPRAAYMPEGVPVNAPTYDFAPYSAPTGEPYKKPDGSTVQPMVTVSPNVTNITYNTYNQTTYNAAGEPVVGAPPSDENADEVKDPCDSNPDRAGCADLGTPTDDQVIPRVEVPLTFEPVAIQQDATCPAPMIVSAFGKSIPISYDGACTYATGLKPIVIAVAYLSALMIIFGFPRSSNG